jgi:membrane-bound ClpP family serine protease
MSSADLAFCSCVLGAGLVYIELLRPGRVIFGLAGLVLIAVGCYELWRNSPAREGLSLVVLALLFFVIEAIWKTWFLAAVAATVSLCWGVVRLFPRPAQIEPALGVTGSILVGAVTTFLSYSAKRARANKRSDLS